MGSQMTYTHPYTRPCRLKTPTTPSRTARAALTNTYTDTYMTYTPPAPTRLGGSLVPPACAPRVESDSSISARAPRFRGTPRARVGRDHDHLLTARHGLTKAQHLNPLALAGCPHCPAPALLGISVGIRRVCVRAGLALDQRGCSQTTGDHWSPSPTLGRS